MPTFIYTAFLLIHTVLPLYTVLMLLLCISLVDTTDPLTCYPTKTSTFIRLGGESQAASHFSSVNLSDGRCNLHFRVEMCEMPTEARPPSVSISCVFQFQPAGERASRVLLV